MNRIGVRAKPIGAEVGVVRPNSEAQADRPSPRGDNRRVDADHFALHIEQRAAGIAVVNRSIGLDEVIVRRLQEIAVQRTDNAGRDREAWRE